MSVQKPAFIIKLPGNIIFLLFGIWLTGFIFVFLWNMVNHLIFRHELIHISREDAWTKFFLVFCTAMCWFNPLMWYAMKRSTEDIELTCDEFVLKDMTEEARFKYASLILETTGDQRGFTTCLSASAKTLKYRLKSITKPKKTYPGTITVGILTFLLFISCGYVALAYGTYSGADLIYYGEDSSMYLFDEVKSKSDFSALHYDTFHGVLDESAFHQYLENLNCMRLTGYYSFSDNKEDLHINLTTPDNSFLWLTLSDRHIQIVSPKNDLEREIYYLPEPTDWDYLETILIEYPSIDVHLYKEANGTYGATVMEMTKAEISFSQTPKQPYKVTIQSFDGSVKTEYSQEKLAEPNTFPLPGYDASYIISADFEDKNGETYTVEYVFNLGGVIGN